MKTVQLSPVTTIISVKFLIILTRIKTFPSQALSLNKFELKKKLEI